MIENIQKRAEMLARAVAPDLRGQEFYILTPQDSPVIRKRLGGWLGLYSQSLDSVCQAELEAQGRWQGPGVAIVADLVAVCETLPSPEQAERHAVGIIMHELGHYLDRPARIEVPTQEAALVAFHEIHDNPPRTSFPAALLGHGDTWNRIMTHLWYRLRHVAGYPLDPRYLSMGGEHPGLEYLPSPPAFIDACLAECAELVDLPLREVAKFEQSAGLIALWNSVLERYVDFGPRFTRCAAVTPRAGGFELP